MRSKIQTTAWVGLVALWGSLVVAQPESGLFPIAHKIADPQSPSFEAVYHGVPVYWPPSFFTIPLDEGALNQVDRTWLWIEKLGKGNLSLEGGGFSDRAWRENPDLSDLVETWEWQRFSFDEKSVQEGTLKFHASPWGDVFLGRFFFTKDPEAVPSVSNALQLTEKTQLAQGRARYPLLDLSWGGAFIQLQGPNGKAIETSVVDRFGHFSALAPRNEEVFAVLLDRLGAPLTERTPVVFEGDGVTFQPLEGQESYLWLGPRDRGVTLRTRGIRGDSIGAEWLCLFRMLDSTGAVSAFLRTVERESEGRKPSVFDFILEDDDLSNRTVDGFFVDFLNRLPSNFSQVPTRRILVAERKTVGKAMTLASEQRDTIEGAIVWGGDPGEAVPSNFDDCPVALLGGRDDLSRMENWIETCNAIQSPLLVASYWSDPDPQTLTADVIEAIGWVNLPPLGRLDPKLNHSTYLASSGRNQWIWITRISLPGSLASVRAEWKPTGIIDIAVENVDRVRVHLNCGLEKPGRQITLSLESLTLPITLGPSFDAIELRKRSDSGWAPRFVQFDEPVETGPMALLPASGFKSGEEFKPFARFVRERLQTDCAWGYLFEKDLPGGPISEIDLCNAVAPVLFSKIEWPFAEIDRFHQWRRERGDLSLNLAGYRPGVAESVEGASKEKLSCAVASTELIEFFQSRPESKSDFETLRVTQRELVGTFLSRQYSP